MCIYIHIYTYKANHHILHLTHTCWTLIWNLDSHPLWYLPPGMHHHGQHKICKKLTQMNSKNQTRQLKTGREFNRHFKEDIQMANRYMERCSNIIRQVKDKR